MNVQEELQKVRDASGANMSSDVKNVVTSFSKQLEIDQVGKDALRKGDRFPQFALKDIFGQTVETDQLLKKGKLVVMFYRGGWCPYCNIELRGYQEIYSKIKEKGAELIALSPEQTDLGTALQKKHQLTFPIVWDKDNAVARKLGLVFKMSPELVDIYKNKFNIDVQASQGNDKFELPIPATYIIDQNGTISLDFVNLDYTQRFIPKDVLNFL
ncbi:MAG: peroxiredoxin-like family protein [Brevinema sp.]